MVWYQCERWKEEMYVYVTETTHIYIYIYIYKYIYVWMGTIRCKVETGKFGKLSQMTSIHNTTLI